MLTIEFISQKDLTESTVDFNLNNPISSDFTRPTIITGKLGIVYIGSVYYLVNQDTYIGDGIWSNNPYLLIKSVTLDGNKVVPTFNPLVHKFAYKSTENGPNHDSMANADKGWILRGGEIWPLNHEYRLTLTQEVLERINTVLNLLGELVDSRYILNNPKLLNLVRLHGDMNSPANAQGNKRDATWLQKNWKQRTGEVEFSVPWAVTALRGAEGWNNCHYDSLFWMLLNYALDPANERNLKFGYTNAVLHATMGRLHTPGHKYQGMARYEKGFTTIGDWGRPDWAKQWSLGLYAWAFVTLDPVLIYAMEQSLDCLKRFTPQQVWDGSWGERIAANWMQELMLAIKVRPGEEIYKTHLNNAIDYYLSLRGPNLYWLNKGNNYKAPATPWMASKLVHALWKATKLIGGPKQANRESEILRTAEAVYQHGFYRFQGVVRARYRFLPDISVAEETPAQVAISLPMFRVMAEANPESYTELYEEVKSWIANNVGVSWSNLSLVPTTDEVGMEYHRQGIGWTKACKMYLQGCKV